MEMSSCSEHDQQVVLDVVKKKRSEVVPGARCLVAGCQAHQPGTQVPGTLAGEPDTWVPGHLAPGTWAPGHVGGVSGTWLGCLEPGWCAWHLAGGPGTWHLAGHSHSRSQSQGVTNDSNELSLISPKGHKRLERAQGQ